MSQYPMTARGAQMLRDELNELKTKTRPRIIEAIAEAREHGDLKENAEYHAAREQQSFCEGRIQDIEGKLSNAQIIDVTKMENTGKVIFGTTVTILNVDTDEETTYRIVGDDEADIKNNLIDRCGKMPPETKNIIENKRKNKCLKKRKTTTEERKMRTNILEKIFYMRKINNFFHNMSLITK